MLPTRQQESSGSFGSFQNFLEMENMNVGQIDKTVQN